MANLQKNLPATFTALAVAGVAVWGALSMRNSQEEVPQTTESLPESTSPTATSQSPASTPTSTTSSPTSTATTGGFKDGSYTATGSYGTPGGTQRIEVTLSLSGGVITKASVKNQATDRESSGFQDEFIAAFSSKVVGKKLSEVSLGKTSGSSLTPRGFNAALATIKNQAS
jgi:uncharacterized protein with FMN-binding domain